MQVEETISKENPNPEEHKLSEDELNIGTDKEEMRSTVILGGMPKDCERFDGLEMGKNFFWDSTALKKVKIWYGYKKGDQNKMENNNSSKNKVIVAIKFWYKDYKGNKKLYADNVKIENGLLVSEIEGPIKKDGVLKEDDKILTDQLVEDEDQRTVDKEVSGSNYFTHVDIICDDIDIYFLKFKAKKNDENNKPVEIQIGDEKRQVPYKHVFDKEGIDDIHITCFRGVKDNNHITGLSYKFMSRTGFFMKLLKDYIGLFTLRAIKKTPDSVDLFDEEKNKIENADKNNNEIVNLLYKTAGLGDPLYEEIVKYLVKVKDDEDN